MDRQQEHEELDDLLFIVNRSFGIIGEAKQSLDAFIHHAPVNDQSAIALGTNLGLVRETERLLWRAKKILEDWETRLKLRGES